MTRKAKSFFIEKTPTLLLILVGAHTYLASHGSNSSVKAQAGSICERREMYAPFLPTLDNDHLISATKSLAILLWVSFRRADLFKEHPEY